MRWLALCALAAGCIRSDATPCGDGRVCAPGTVCVTLTEGTGDPHRCVEPPRVGCAGAETHESCAGGICYAAEGGGVCLPGGCANFLLDDGEQCDDGNNLPGDGCSADCASNETCGNTVVDLGEGEQCDDADTISRDGCSSTCAGETPRWTSTAFAFDRRGFMATAYDVARRRVVMFGGGVFTTVASPEPDFARFDTWEWDGASWLQRSPRFSPPARYGHAMAYDGIRHRVVMFGGREDDDLNDTWEWNGEAWTATGGAAPPRRSHHTMVFDAARRRIVLFGGFRDGVALDDTWTFDGAAWSELATTGRPPARGRHVMAYDPERGIVVIAGGTTTSDSWELDGTTWTQTAAMLPLENSAAAFDPATHRVTAFGGRTRADLVTNQMLAYDGDAWTAVLSATPPSVREGHGLLSDPVAGGLILSPGIDLTSGQINRATTAVWNGDDWAGISPQTPPVSRLGPAVAYDPANGRVLLFGGLRDGSVYLDDTWVLEGDHWRPMPLQPVGQQPGARYRAATAFDTARGQAVMFGGYNGSAEVLAETWLWNGTWAPAAPATSPPPRYDAHAAFDSHRARVVMFGGRDSSGVRADTWEWDGATWLLATSAGPPARASMAIGYDPIRRRTVVFGGAAIGGNLSDTWEWDGTTWTERTPPVSPPVTIEGAMTWNSARGVLVLHGGRSSNGQARDTTWEWDGIAWRQLETQDSPARSSHIAFPHPSGAGIAFYGGLPTTSSLDDLWLLAHTGTSSTYESCVDGTDLDGDGAGGCDDPDCWHVCAPLCPPGMPCDPAAPHCGDGTCNAALENCRLCASDCGACPAICGDFTCDASETATGCPGDCAPP